MWGYWDGRYLPTKTRIVSDDPRYNLLLCAVEVKKGSIPYLFPIAPQSSKPEIMIGFAIPAGLYLREEVLQSELHNAERELRPWAKRQKLELARIGGSAIIWQFELNPRKPFSYHAMEIAKDLFESLGIESARWFRTLEMSNYFRRNNNEKWMTFEEFLLKEYQPAGLKEE